MKKRHIELRERGRVTGDEMEKQTESGLVCYVFMGERRLLIVGLQF